MWGEIKKSPDIACSEKVGEKFDLAEYRKIRKVIIKVKSYLLFLSSISNPPLGGYQVTFLNITWIKNVWNLRKKLRKENGVLSPWGRRVPRLKIWCLSCCLWPSLATETGAIAQTFMSETERVGDIIDPHWGETTSFWLPSKILLKCDRAFPIQSGSDRVYTWLSTNGTNPSSD